MSASRVRIALEKEPVKQEMARLQDDFIAEMESQLGDMERSVLHLLARDEAGQLVGGAIGYCNFGWLVVKTIWVAPQWRGQGIGHRLLRMAEAEGKRRGCHAAWLETLGCQAPGFYQRMGYESFALIPDYVKGHGRHFFMRRF